MNLLGHISAPSTTPRQIRRDAAPIAGQSLPVARRDAERGWTVLGLAREGPRTDRRTTVRFGDEMFVAGSDEAIQSADRTVARS